MTSDLLQEVELDFPHCLEADFRDELPIASSAFASLPSEIHSDKIRQANTASVPKCTSSGWTIETWIRTRGPASSMILPR